MVVIIGAGLSGLLTAYRLKKQGIPFKILEARSRLGGRINTVLASEKTPVEMGATWFSAPHLNLISLLEELGLDYFEQYMDDAVYFQHDSNSPVQKLQLPPQSPSYRICGGSSKLINTLYQTLDAADILFNQKVRSITFHDNSFQIIADETFEASHIVLALPPKLWSMISFKPELENHLLNIAETTHTWMEDSIKIALTYSQPFWQQENKLGTLFCNSGPVTEFYDHCNNQRSKYALCGFINSDFKGFTKNERQGLVMNQIKNVFGSEAEDYLDYVECVWSEEEYTFSASDIALFPHQNNGNPIFLKSILENRLFISGSESSAQFPGYMDGAVYAGNQAAEKIISVF